ncbi:excinuclease ABC subunit A [Armatimonas rosea]|uniref:UvrABC system protein A n=1 Tax=Armatimonas rosea TaxID=685828 RepID=A0A7W9W9D0_ARMRO|nr:excinuclease ABC subunit A [Armatimonas rosea]
MNTRSSHASSSLHSHIVVRGARQNNLKNIDIDIPRDQLVVITGLSGSGKSSLAFDTLFAEGQRRYVESLSAYARQFLGQMDKPDVDQIEGLSPAVSIDQKSTSKNPRSTVGTVTEIYDYLRLLFARVGTPHCPKCGKPVTQQQPSQIVDVVMTMEEGARIQVLAPIIRGRKGEYKKELEELKKEGFARVRVDGTVYDLESVPTLDRYKQHDIDIVVDRIVVKPGVEKRVADSVETALKRSKGLVGVEIVGGEVLLFSENFACTSCGISLPEIEPRTFSFNSPFGACETCHGLGTQSEFDPELIAPDREMSIGQGGIKYFVYKSGKEIMSEGRTALFAAVAKKLGFTMETPLKKLTETQLHSLFYGIKGNVTMESKNRFGRTRHFDTEFPGVIAIMERHWNETSSDYIKQDLEQYRRNNPCPACKGQRLKPEALGVLFGGKNISQITAFSIAAAVDFVEKLTLTEREMLIARQILKEIGARLGFLKNVGLGYLTLDRAAGSLSGGEAQRIRLATQIGSGLMGVLYILDEPSIGLHQRDNTRLIETLVRLRDLGNTILVVEHDEETMEAADWLIDIGPGAGIHGGYVVAQGPPSVVKESPDSVTGAYLSGRKKIAPPAERRKGDGRNLTIVGARGNNLKNVTAQIPLGTMTVVTGVSGSGKSTLIQDTLYPRLMNEVYRSHMVASPHTGISGIEHIEKVIDIDQSPIGRTPRSNPATYTGTFDLIRDLFAATPEAKVRGYGPGRFSFNVKGGRCEACQGDGILKIEMHFLPDVYVPCEVCKGARYSRETLQVTYKGKSISDVLNMSVGEAVEFFEAVPRIARKVKTIADVGLDYIKLGQPATTLSGGEAQRVKLATELSKRSHAGTIYILDEPTTGLHFADIEKLLTLLQRLVDAGATVLVIEHNLDVIKCADWVLDLGPEGGDGGGMIVATGTPEQIAQCDTSHTGRYLKKML